MGEISYSLGRYLFNRNDPRSQPFHRSFSCGSLSIFPLVAADRNPFSFFFFPNLQRSILWRDGGQGLLVGPEPPVFLGTEPPVWGKVFVFICFVRLYTILPLMPEDLPSSFPRAPNVSICVYRDRSLIFPTVRSITIVVPWLFRFSRLPLKLYGEPLSSTMSALGILLPTTRCSFPNFPTCLSYR